MSNKFGPCSYRDLSRARQGHGGTTNLWAGSCSVFTDDMNQRKFRATRLDSFLNELNEYYSKTYKKLGFTPPISEYPEKLGTTTSGKTLESFYTYWRASQF